MHYAKKTKVRTAKDLFSIASSENETQGAIFKELQGNQGESLLLLLDGYDELPEDVQNNSMIAKVVSSKLLPNATVLVTSRLSCCGCQRSEDFQHIEVLGFMYHNIDSYTINNIDPKQLKLFQEYLSCYPNIRCMLHNPLNAP